MIQKKGSVVQAGHGSADGQCLRGITSSFQAFGCLQMAPLTSEFPGQLQEDFCCFHGLCYGDARAKMVPSLLRFFFIVFSCLQM